MTGMLFYNTETGLSGCGNCGWSGVPTRTGGRKIGKPMRPFGEGTNIVGYKVVDSVRSDTCPACEAEPYDLEPEVEKVGRNEPCPCGSRLKYKKCHGARA